MSVSFFNYSTSAFGACATSRRVSGSIPGGVAGDFFRGSDGTMCPGVDLASKNEYQEISWGWRRPVRKGDDLTTFIVPNVEKIQEPLPPGTRKSAQACSGITLSLPLHLPLVPRCEKCVLLLELTRAKLVNKQSTYYRNRPFITVLKKPRNWPCAKSD
jgi:hypothetical protein